MIGFTPFFQIILLVLFFAENRSIHSSDPILSPLFDCMRVRETQSLTESKQVVSGLANFIVFVPARTCLSTNKATKGLAFIFAPFQPQGITHSLLRPYFRIIGLSFTSLIKLT